MKPYYERDGITIYHGDCREILPLIEADVMVTDPPYGIAHSSNRSQAPLRGRQIAHDHDTSARDELLMLWGDRPVILFGTCKAPAPPIKTRAVLVWDKGGEVGMGDLTLPWKQNWEHIYVAGPGFTGRRDTGVLRYNALSPRAPHAHPHEKPVALLAILIVKCPAGVVLDPFMGSGTTLRAAKDLGRKAIGIEIEERYCEIAAKRMGQGVLFGSETGKP